MLQLTYQPAVKSQILAILFCGFKPNLGMKPFSNRHCKQRHDTINLMNKKFGDFGLILSGDVTLVYLGWDRYPQLRVKIWRIEKPA